MTLGSGIAMLDGTVVNIALRHIGTDLGATLADLQWVSNGYLLSLASLILVGGALGDRLGRRRTYLMGSRGSPSAARCAPSRSRPMQLVVFRVLQGVAAALLAPGALAIIQASFRKADRPAAIGTWAGAAGIAVAIGPFLGGFLVEHAGWRWVFAINLPLCALVLHPRHADARVAGRGRATALRLPGRPRRRGGAGYDDLPAHLVARPLRPGRWSWSASWSASSPAVAFVVLEERPGAMAPLSMFRSRVFSAANLMTLLVYGALGAVLFFLVLQLQVTAGYDAIAAGVATLPIPS